MHTRAVFRRSAGSLPDQGFLSFCTPYITPDYLSRIKNGTATLSKNILARIAELERESDGPLNANEADTTPPVRHDNLQDVLVLAIKIDRDIQQRAETNQDVICGYADFLKEREWPNAEWPYPPLDVFDTPEGQLLVDGFHRLAAARAVLSEGVYGEVAVPCHRHQWTRDHAVLFAVGANATHGLLRTTEDKRLAVRTLLRHPEWSLWSSRAIAEKAHVSHTLVNQIRAELEHEQSVVGQHPDDPEQEVNSSGRTSSQLDVDDPSNPAPGTVNPSGRISSGIDVNETSDPVDKPQPQEVVQPNQRKTKNGRLITVRPSAPPSQPTDQPSTESESGTDSANQTQPTDPDPQQRIEALSSALIACRDDSLVQSDHFKVAECLIPSLRHALDQVEPQDCNQLMQPLLEWHMERQEALS